MVFAISIEENEVSNAFFSDMRKRLLKGFLRAPFETGIIQRAVPGVVVFHLRPSYPHVYIFGFVLLFGALVFTRFQLTAYLIPGAVLSSTGLLWTDFFQFVMLRIGLKKAGYTGRIKLLRAGETIRRLL